jgi:hypothetical protein
LIIQEMTGWENYVVRGRSVYPDTIRALSDDPAQRYETGRKVLAIGDSGGVGATVQGELVMQADETGDTLSCLVDGVLVDPTSIWVDR